MKKVLIKINYALFFLASLTLLISSKIMLVETLLQKILNINTILSKVLNGHVFSQNELSEIMILDEDKRNEMIKYHELKDKVGENNGITLEDFNKVTEVMGIDSNIADLFRKSFDDSNLIIDSYHVKKH